MLISNWKRIVSGYNLWFFENNRSSWNSVTKKIFHEIENYWWFFVIVMEERVPLIRGIEGLFFVKFVVFGSTLIKGEGGSIYP